MTHRIGVHNVKSSVEDIFNLLEVIDSNELREHLPIFCAANMARIPMMPEETSDIASIRYELSMLRKQVEFLSGNLRPSSAPVWKVDNTCEQRTMADDKDFPPLAYFTFCSKDDVSFLAKSFNPAARTGPGTKSSQQRDQSEEPARRPMRTRCTCWALAERAISTQYDR